MRKKGMTIGVLTIGMCITAFSHAKDSCDGVFKMKLNEMYRESSSSFDEMLFEWYSQKRADYRSAGSSTREDWGAEGMNTGYGDYTLDMSKASSRSSVERWYSEYQKSKDYSLNKDEFNSIFSKGLPKDVQMLMTKAWENCMNQGGLSISCDFQSSSRVVLTISHVDTGSSEPVIISSYEMSNATRIPGSKGKFVELAEGTRLGGGDITLQMDITNKHQPFTFTLNTKDEQGNPESSASYTVPGVAKKTTKTVQPELLQFKPVSLTLNQKFDSSKNDHNFQTGYLNFSGRAELRHDDDNNRIIIRTSMAINEISENRGKVDIGKPTYYESEYKLEIVGGLKPGNKYYFMDGNRKIRIPTLNKAGKYDTPSDHFSVNFKHGPIAPFQISKNDKSYPNSFGPITMPTNNGIASMYQWHPQRGQFVMEFDTINILTAPSNN